LQGEAIDRDRHDLANDVKAVTLHQLSVQRTSGGSWEARVVLDV
jgi:SHS2 domain-containing protein